MTRKTSHIGEAPDPAAFEISERSAARLSAISGVPADDLAGLTVAQVRERFPYQIDPGLFWFQKVCGQVVKTDPATGVDYPVPFATVNVEDTDCSFLGFFPVDDPWSWLFPFFCSREVIATTQTDACGAWCVWVPRWDIDWVLRFRFERECYPIILQRPSLADIIDQVVPKPGPNPGPEAPITAAERSRLVARIAESYGRDAATRAARLISHAGFGASTVSRNAALNAPAMLSGLRPPLPAEMKPGRRHAHEAHPAVTALAGRLGLEAADLAAVDLARFVGPFLRCFDVLVPEWVPILDVPDITFSVWQDTDGDGDLEQIYGESYFDVRWDTIPTTPVVIHAGPTARAGVLCGPTNIPCGDVPAIVMAGRLPVTGDPTLYDDVGGFGLRTNRPKADGLYNTGLPRPEAQAPFFGDLSLYGCNGTDPAADSYRLVYRYSADGGATFTAPTPFVGLSWPLYRLNGMGVGEWWTVSADPQGWYPIALPPGPNAWQPEDLLLDWYTPNFADGLYAVTLELGAGGAVTSSSAEVAFTVDNAAPTGTFTVSWGFSAATAGANPLTGPCAVLPRGTTPVDVYIQVSLAGASKHLRSLELYPDGCAAGNVSLVSGTGGAQEPAGGTTYDHWHTSPSDDSATLTVVYLLPAAAPEGAYGFAGEVSSRAFNPSGWDGGQLQTPPWQYDPDDVYITPSVAFAVINA